MPGIVQARVLPITAVLSELHEYPRRIPVVERQERFQEMSKLMGAFPVPESLVPRLMLVTSMPEPKPFVAPSVAIAMKRERSRIVRNTKDPKRVLMPKKRRQIKAFTVVTPILAPSSRRGFRYLAFLEGTQKNS